MKEKEIDISTNKPKLLTFQMAQNADLIVTMGCNDQGICPGPFFKPTIDWKLEDPKGKPIEKAREIRDDIKQSVKGAINFVSDFEENAKGLTKEKGCDVAVCGHIHQPKLEADYMNSGDFCENSTCLVEDFEGNWKIIFV